MLPSCARVVFAVFSSTLMPHTGSVAMFSPFKNLIYVLLQFERVVAPVMHIRLRSGTRRKCNPRDRSWRRAACCGSGDAPKARAATWPTSTGTAETRTGAYRPRVPGGAAASYSHADQMRRRGRG